MQSTARVAFALLICFGLAANGSAQEGAAKESTHESPAAPQSDDSLTGVHQAIDSYVKAFNQGDAAALAKHWTSDGELVLPSGESVKGQKALTENFEVFFKATSGAKLELLGTEVRLLSPKVAMETGVARIVLSDSSPDESEYEAIYVRQGDVWKLDRVTDKPAPAAALSQYEKLKPLEWMVGEWSNNAGADSEATFSASCRWTTNRNFLLRTFRVYVGSQVDFEGTQIIGWDPRSEAIRSWVFDSDGGFGVGRWSQTGGGWSVQTLHVLPDGRQGSSTNVYELVDENTVRFRSVGRQVDGELLPSIEPVTVGRTITE